MSDALRGELPSLRVIAALLLINPDDPADPDDLEAAAMLLARRVLREIDDALDGGDPLPRRPCLSVVRQFAASSPDLANERGPPWRDTDTA